MIGSAVVIFFAGIAAGIAAGLMVYAVGARNARPAKYGCGCPECTGTGQPTTPPPAPPVTGSPLTQPINRIDVPAPLVNLGRCECPDCRPDLYPEKVGPWRIRGPRTGQIEAITADELDRLERVMEAKP